MRTSRVFSLAKFLLPGLAAPVLAQDPGTDDLKAILFPEKGRHHLAVSTKSKDAQVFIDQGISFHYGFNHVEAIRSFRRAAELDPALAMAWWGIGLALGPNYNRDIDPVDAGRNRAAFEATRKAVEMSKYASPREKAYIQALSKRYSLDVKADQSKLERDYRAAMKKVMDAHPDDLDAAVLYVEAIMNLRPWKLWTPQGQPAEDTEEAMAVLQSVLRRDPRHIGACHYHIHLMEASPFPERALPSADRLLRQAPWQGHLTHMPGHIYIHTGDFDLAALANELAIEADEAFLARRPHKGLYKLMYYPHNIHFLAFARTCQGDYGLAIKAANKLAYFVEPELDAMPMLEGFAVFPLMVNLRFQRWDEVLKMPEPAPKRTGMRLFFHFAKGMAHAAKGERKKAEKDQAEFLKVAADIPPETPMGTNSAGQLIAVAKKNLEAKLAADLKDSIALWREVVKLEDELNYGEPPDWIFRGRESLGAALLRTGKAKEAEKVFREDLTKLRRNGRALFGLSHSLRAQKREEDADFVQRQFQDAWPGPTPLRLEDF